MYVSIGSSKCMYRCEQLHVGKVYIIALHIHTCVWMPNVDTECGPQWFSSFSTVEGSITELVGPVLLAG